MIARIKRTELIRALRAIVGLDSTIRSFGSLKKKSRSRRIASRSVLFRFSSDGLLVYGFTTMPGSGVKWNGLSVTLPYDKEPENFKPVDFFLDSKLVIDILSSRPLAKFVEFESDEVGSPDCLMIRTVNGGTIQFAGKEIYIPAGETNRSKSDYQLPEPIKKRIFKIDRKLFFGTVDKMLAFVPEGRECRESLNHVLMEYVDNDLRFFATDGRLLGYVTICKSNTGSKFFASRSKIPKVLKNYIHLDKHLLRTISMNQRFQKYEFMELFETVCKSKEKKKANVYSGYILRAGNYTYYFHVKEIERIEYEAVLVYDESTAEFCYTVDKDELLESLDSVMSIFGSDVRKQKESITSMSAYEEKLKFISSKNNVSVQEVFNSKADGSFLEQREQGGAGGDEIARLNFSPFRMKKFSSYFDGKEIKIMFDDPLSAIRMSDGNMIAYLMPMRV